MSHPPRPPRSLVAAALAALLGLSGLLASAAPAAASSGSVYQFWGYYQLTDGQWSFAQTGPDGTEPADGSVEGWRFAISGADPRMPRATPTFEEICGTTPAPEGSKRVGVVLDYGRPADSTDGATPPEPRAECAVVPAAATGADVLAEVAEVRTGDGGLTCALDGYPASGCGEALPEVPPAAAEPDEPVELAGLAGAEATTPAADGDSAAAAETPAEDGGGTGVAWWLGAAVAVVVVALAVVALRRRRVPEE